MGEPSLMQVLQCIKWNLNTNINPLKENAEAINLVV